MRTAAIVALGALCMSTALAEENPKVDPRFDERVSVRRYFKGNKDKDGKPLEYLNPDNDVPAYRRIEKNETKFFLSYQLDPPNPMSEITDADGDLWEVVKCTKQREQKDEKGNVWYVKIATVKLKKKAEKK